MKRTSLLSLLLAMLLCLPACGKPSEKQIESTPTENTESNTETETEDLTHRYAANVPEANYEGYTFRVITPKFNGRIITQFHADEQTGDSVNDALFERNARVASQFNVKFTETNANDWMGCTDQLKATIRADTDDYDLNMVIQRDAFSCALENMILTADQLPYLDPTQPWYAHELNNQLSIQGKMYLVYSSECLNMHEQTLLVEFNKQIFQNNNLDDPYPLVDEMKWTYDKMFDLAKAAMHDTNGDDIINDCDVVGIVSESDMFWPTLWVGCNLRTIEKDDTGFPIFNADTNEPLLNLLSYLAASRSTKGLTFDSSVDEAVQFAGNYTNGRDLSTKIFTQSHAAFRVLHVGSLKLQLEMEDDFGLLPCPMYNEEQNMYCSRIIDGWLNIVPSNNRDPERTSIIMESLAAESENLVIPAYYEKVLKGRLARDPESKKILDIVFDTPTIDFGDTVWQGDVRNTILPMITGNNDQFASRLKKMHNSMNKKLERAVPRIEETAE